MFVNVSLCWKKEQNKNFSCQGRQKDVSSALIASNVDGSDVHVRALCSLSSCLFHLQPQRISVLDHMLKERFALMAKFDSWSCWLKCLFVFLPGIQSCFLRQEVHPLNIVSNTVSDTVLLSFWPPGTCVIFKSKPLLIAEWHYFLNSLWSQCWFLGLFDNPLIGNMTSLN